MAQTIEIVQVLIRAGYLAEADSEAALSVLASTLDDDLLDMRAEDLGDEEEQQQMISGAREAAAQDAAMGDKREQKIDKSIIQDSIGKEEVDEADLRHVQKEIAEACKSAAKSLAHSRLIDKSHVNDVSSLIQKTWLDVS